MQDSKQESTQEETCSAWPVLGADICGAYVARWLFLRGVGMRGLYGTLDNVYSVGVLRLLSMRIGKTSNSKAARLHVWGFYVVRCMCGGIYGALLSVHGMGGHNVRRIIHALLLHALALCQRARRICHWGT